MFSLSVANMICIQVINNLFRYMTEPGANEELFSLIIVSALGLIRLLLLCELNNDLFGSGFNDGLGRQDVERVRGLVY